MKKEILVTNNVEKFSIAKEKLSFNNIKYKYKVISNDEASFSIFSFLFKDSRRSRGSLGEKINFNKTYYLYVDSKNYELAKKVLEK